ncbi:3-oxosteroid 1-dehydrogenase [compost metagenome]
MIFDQRALETFAGNNPIPSDLREVDYVIQGETLAELHNNIQQRLDKLKDRIAPQTLPADFASTLQATIERYNQFAQQGMDGDFKRGAHPAETEWQAYFSRPRPGKEEETRKMPNATMHPLADKGPYYAVILAPGALDTNAGPMIDEEARILSASGEPIPGLYGAGNCINSPTGTAYLGAGGTIGPAMTFGFIAARSAHQANG